MAPILNYTTGDILEILGEAPQLVGLHVYFQRKAIRKIPFSHPYRTDNYIIHFVVRGRLSMQLNLVDHELVLRDIIVIPPHTVISFNWIDEKVELMTISFSMDFALANSYKNEVFAFDFFATKIIRKIKVDADQWESFLSIARYMEKKNLKSNAEFFRKETASHAFNIFLYELAIASRSNNQLLKNILNRKEDLTSRFLKILEKDFKKQRLISYYSDSLCVSSSYLTKAVKSVTGKTVGKLIEDSMVTEAKILLAETKYSILQISEELEYSDQSFFSKFFKKGTGMTPTEYRNRI